MLDNGASIYIAPDSDYAVSPYEDGDYMHMTAVVRSARGRYDTFESCDTGMPIRADVVVDALREHDCRVVVRWLRSVYGLTVVADGDDIYYSREPVSDVRSEIALLDAWRRGETGGWVVEDSAGREIGSCWGFYLTDSERAYMVERPREVARALKAA
ncbi:hypothetical protein [Nocardia terpenica]|uniref:Uncharacterized protein n=1 Tax=Nocardia terpenica TaxID=455432 RepID=A0A164K6B4_9NOCA|nr:hypothetical protein [Nocardia terpenica]KZM71081.1 hypothetical protein AWN90_41965 [Nocardia terpenica]NQE89593.1 hypothetical protein [Nocardia terpenica]